MMFPVRLLMALAWLATSAAAQDIRFFSMGSGSIDGGYYAASNAICGAINRASGGNPRCSPEPTSGSLYNLSALRDEQFEFALVQSDWQRFAYEGTDVFTDDGPMSNMRSVMSLYPEAVTILVRPELEVNGLFDLVGLRVDLGDAGSGRLPTLTRLLAELDLPPTYFARTEGLPTSTAIDALCAGQIDASILIVGHPNAAVARAVTSCGIEIVQFADPEVTEVLAQKSDYVRTTIDRGLYPGLRADVPTYGVIATMVTREDVDADLVQTIVELTLENLVELRSRTRLLGDLQTSGMGTRGLTAPLHSGAAAAYAAFEEATPAVPSE